MSRRRSDQIGVVENPTMKEALEGAFGREFIEEIRVHSVPCSAMLSPPNVKLLSVEKSTVICKAPKSTPAKVILRSKNRSADTATADRVQKASKKKSNKLKQRREQMVLRHKAILRALPPLPHGKPQLSEQRLAGQASNDAARLQFNQKQRLTTVSAINLSSTPLGKLTFNELRAEWTKLIGRLLHYDEADGHLCDGLLLKISGVEAEWARRRALMPDDAGYFKWPSTSAAPSGNGSISEEPWTAIGMLGYLGYHVGKSGLLNREQRQRLLAYIFDMSLPPLESIEYMVEWSVKSTPERLKKIVDCIASFTRHAKRRKNVGLAIAIGDWETDLDYLKRRFYVGKFHYAFDWPSSSI